MALYLHPSLYNGQSLSHVGMVLFSGSGNPSLSTSWPSGRISFILSQVVSWIGVSRASDPIVKFPPLLLLFAIFKHIFRINLYDESNPPLNTVQRMVSKVLMFHENTELLPSVDCYDLYPGNNDPTDQITLVLLGISVQNQPDWVESAKEDRA